MQAAILSARLDWLDRLTFPSERAWAD